MDGGETTGRSLRELAAARLGPGDPEELQAEDRDTARLVELSQAGDRDAFGLLYARYVNRVYGYLRALVRDRHEAEDLTQSVFADLLEDLDVYKPRPGKPFRAWLFVVVRNAAINHLRRAERLQVEDPETITRRRDRAGGADPETPVLDWISDSDLLLFVERLPEPQRQVLVLRFLFDLPGVEIARALDRSHGEVRKLQHRAIKFLRERLEAVRSGPEAEVDAGEREENGWQRRLSQAKVLRDRRFALMK